MSSTKREIEQLEEELMQAELGPEPEFFEKYIDEDMIFVAGGEASKPKRMIVEAHGKGPKFTRVEMSDMTIIDQGNAAVVTCQGFFEGPQGSHTLKFMRVWAKKEDGWRIVAGAMI